MSFLTSLKQLFAAKQSEAGHDHGHGDCCDHDGAAMKEEKTCCKMENGQPAHDCECEHE